MQRAGIADQGSLVLMMDSCTAAGTAKSMALIPFDQLAGSTCKEKFFLIGEEQNASERVELGL